MSVLREPAEVAYAAELERLATAYPGEKPPGWKLTPRAVRAFVIGDEKHQVTRKFYGDDALVDRCVVTLMSNRGLLLVGEPGTAKSMLSELFTAAISGDSTCTIQGSSGTTEDQIGYSWNYALLLAEGPSARSLVPGPLHQALTHGTICRFEELTRVQPEIQDVLIAVMSDKVLHIPELPEPDDVVFANRGFNVVGTANLRDRGVHEMSSALKRRFNFETVRPIRDRALERRLIEEQTSGLLDGAGISTRLTPDAVDLLVTAFSDLREGVTAEGTVVEKPAAVMSSAEAVAVGYAAALDAHYFGDGEVAGRHISRQLIGTVLKDNPDDGTKLRHYFDTVIRPRAKRDQRWKSAMETRGELDR